MLKIVTLHDTQKLKQAAADELTRLLRESPGPTLLLLAGGSSFDLLSLVDPSVVSARCSIAMFDERFEENPDANGFARLMRLPFYEFAKKNGATFYDSRVQKGDDLALYGARMEKNVKDWLAKHSEGTKTQTGKVIATFGIGPDRHTGGMMPFPEDPKLFAELFEGRQLVVGYDNHGKNEFRFRATGTMTLIEKHVSGRVVYAVGHEKKEALQAVFVADGSLAETPARIHREARNATLFTDVGIDWA